MGKFINLTGMTFDRLAVSERLESKHNKAMWKCLCTCGNTVIASTGDLRSGNTKSCGCLRSDRCKEGIHLHSCVGQLSLTYESYSSMLSRCRNPNHSQWSNYGGRGITVCDQWQESFEFFLKDMGERPSSDYSIDRIDTNGNYHKGNCRWATRKVQNRNKRSNHVIEWNGKTQTLVEWSEELGINRMTLNARINTYKWSIERAFTYPVK